MDTSEEASAKMQVTDAGLTRVAAAEVRRVGGMLGTF